MKRALLAITTVVALAGCGADTDDETTIEREPTRDVESAEHAPTTETEPAERVPTTEAPAERPLPMKDRRAIQRNLRAAFRAYNRSDGVGAARYVSDAPVSACGGATAHAFAYVKARRDDSTTRYDIRVTKAERTTEVRTSDISPVPIPEPAYDVEYSYAERADDGTEDTRGNEDSDVWTREGGRWVTVDDFVVVDPYCER